ncbi:MAG: protein-arginine deiminase family protein [Bacteriovoracaceae bacterium]
MEKWLILITCFLLLPLLEVKALSCNEEKEIPLCPASNSTILDDTYPTQSFVISARGAFTDNDNTGVGEAPYEMSSDFVATVLQSYGANKPQIIIPTEKARFDLLILKVKERLKLAHYSESQITEALAAIIWVDNNSYTWQQDYFESFISPQSGTPVVRPISSLGTEAGKPSSDFMSKLQNKTLSGIKDYSICPVEIGSPLKSFKDKSPLATSAGEMGGNIEGLPGGLCFKGNNQAWEFVMQYCGSKENVVEIDNAWLGTGHIDEIMKVVPTFPKKNPSECNFSLLAASPKKAFEVLKKESTKPFLDLSGLNSIQRKAKIEKFLKLGEGVHSISKSVGGILCEMIVKIPVSPVTKPNSKINAVNLWNILIVNAFAHEAVQNCSQRLEQVTNGEMVKAFEENEAFMLLNNLIQEKMDKNKEIVLASLKQRLPNCTNINFVDVPDFFVGETFAEINGKKVLAEPGMAFSLFPNPTNSVVSNKTLIVPESPNAAFNQEYKEVISKQGMKTHLIDTWNYAHRGGGNIHCVSHSIPYCRPQDSK